MDFYKLENALLDGNQYDDYVKNPVSKNGEEMISKQFLNDNFGKYETATEMKNATKSEGLKKFFDYLVEEGKLPQ